MIQLQKVRKIYFIGIGGMGMSAVAGIAKERGFEVSGSDAKTLYDPSKDVLDRYGISYIAGYKAANIQAFAPDLIVVGGGETNENPEVKAALRMKVQLTSFPEFLFVLVKEKTRIVISGTHGKTTTTSLIAFLLKECDLDPGYFIGGVSKDLAGNFHFSDGKYFVIEGDEYYASFFDKTPKFHYYHPNVLVLNNIEMDHYDFFDSEEMLLRVFSQLVQNMPTNSVVVANAEDENVKKVLKTWQGRVVWLSTHDPNADWYAAFSGYEENMMRFHISKNGEHQNAFFFSKPGDHYMKNSLAALAVADLLGCDLEKMRESLARFQGPMRRFEKVGEHNDIILYDDFAHHPTAVFETLNAAKKMYPQRKLWAIYEPHTFTRTLETLDQLKGAFLAADQVIIPDIYPAREKHLSHLIDSQRVVDVIATQHSAVRYIPIKEKVLRTLTHEVKSGDVVVVMAVGAFSRLSYELYDALKKHV